MITRLNLVRYSKRVGRFHRMMIRAKLRHSEAFPQCRFARTVDPLVFMCPQCKIGVRLKPREAEAALYGSTILIHRDCKRPGVGDRCARLFHSLGFRKSVDCDCEARQEWLNSFGFVLGLPVRWLYPLGIRFGHYLKEKRK